MKFMTLASAFAAFAFASNAFATTKVCFGSTKDDEIKGMVIIAEFTADSITLKPTKGDYFAGTFPSTSTVVHGRDGATYLEYDGGYSDYQNVMMVDSKLLNEGTHGLFQIRARGEGFFNAAFYCRDSK